MKLKKAVQENDIDNQFLKDSTRLISPYLIGVLSKESFLMCLRSLKLCLFINEGILIYALTTDQYLSYLLLLKSLTK